MLRRRGLYAVVILLVLFALLHVNFSPKEQAFNEKLAIVLGGFAYLLMSMSLLLSTRAKWLESLCGGLDRVYQLHKIAGVCVLFALLPHFFSAPEALPAGADIAANALIPSKPLGMFALILAVLLLIVTLNRKISYNRWFSTHKFMGLVYILATGHLMTMPPVFFERTSPAGIMLITASIVGILSFIYTLFIMKKRNTALYKIEAITSLERATEVVLSPKGKGIAHKAGQFAFVTILGKGWQEPHPFTISSAPNENKLRFTIKVLGDWTRKVREELQTGLSVKIQGPYGKFDCAKAGKKQVWIAGGIGLTPFLSTLRAMEKGDTREIHMVYATRSQADAIFLDALKSYENTLENITLRTLYSDEGQFAKGEVIQEQLTEALTDYDYFICGPKPMVTALIRYLRKAGVARNKIHCEAFEFR